VAIRRSSSADVEALITELRDGSGGDARREAALARLAIIGRRAVSHILEALARVPNDEDRTPLLLALERIPDVRAVDVILRSLELPAGPTNLAMRVAAIRAARPLLDVSPAGTLLFERLTRIVLDSAEPSAVRCAAVEGMSDLPARTLKPLRQRLADDPDSAVRTAARGSRHSPGGSGATALTRDLPDDPDAALAAVGAAAADTPLSTLHAVLKAVRERESGAGRRRTDWLGVRGAIHLALARRNSRVALYDLREAFEATDDHPLPADFVAAVTLIGDGSCLEPLARAWMRAPALGRRDRGAAWARQTRDAFRDVLSRQTLASRRKTLGRLQQRWVSGEDAERLRELIELERGLGRRAGQ
jgi:hypothetical protein